LQLADCREALRQSNIANQRLQEANFELHEQYRTLYNIYQSEQVVADPEAGLHHKNCHYVATHQALQHSGLLRERRVGEQMEDDGLSEDDRKVDKDKLPCQVVSWTHLLAEMKEALETETRKNTIQDRRIMVLESILISLKQKHTTRRVGGA